MVGERLCDAAAVGEALVLELEELVEDTLVLHEVVADILVLCDAAPVADSLVL